MIVIVTLTSPGADTGPFSLFSSVDTGTPLVTGISRAALIAGYTLNSVPDSATFIKVQSTGTCTNFVNLNITNPTTTTTTTTARITTTTTTTSGGPTTTTTSTTATPAHPYAFNLSTGYSSGALACGDGTSVVTVYGDSGSFLANTILYAASTGSTVYTGSGLYYNNVDIYVYVQINNSGVITDSGICP